MAQQINVTLELLYVSLNFYVKSIPPMVLGSPLFYGTIRVLPKVEFSQLSKENIPHTFPSIVCPFVKAYTPIGLHPSFILKVE